MNGSLVKLSASEIYKHWHEYKKHSFREKTVLCKGSKCQIFTINHYIWLFDSNFYECVIQNEIEKAMAVIAFSSHGCTAHMSVFEKPWKSGFVNVKY